MKDDEAVLCDRWSEGKRVLSRVYDLKQAIKAENKNDLKRVTFLQLFLAKKDVEWLNGDDAEAVTLDEHGQPQGFV